MTNPPETTSHDGDAAAERASAKVHLDRAARRRLRKERRKAERAAALASAGDGEAAPAADSAAAAASPAAAESPVEAESPAAAESPVAAESPAAAESTPAEDEVAGSEGFASFGLIPELMRAVERAGFAEPTPIQAATIPVLLEGRDVIGQAQTGTGKTAAFALPLLQRLDLSRREVQALVLVPTRELANQVAAAVTALSRSLGGVGVLPIYGGQSMIAQLNRLDRGVHVVVGTPGRVMDHLRRGSLQIGALSTLVLDEADEMLRMGFIEDVEWILEQAPEAGVRQTALFSATMPPPVRRVATRHLADPVTVAIDAGAPAISTIDQRFLWARGQQKFDVLCRLLETEERDAALVFTRTRARSSDLADALTADGFAAEALHGDMSQAHRESVLRRLRNGDVRIVVATDVAARGLDVDTISLVINFDVAMGPETYVHRIGRTGRAGRAGVSVLFLEPNQRRDLAGIERYTGQRLQEVRAPTAGDVAAHRIGRFKAAVSEAIEAEDLDVYQRVVEEIAREGSHDMARVAAAIAHLAADRRPLFPAPAPEPQARPEPEQQRGSRRPPDDGAMVPLVLAVGRDWGVSPGDIVGAIANEAGVPGRAVGAIDIGERTTFVDVHAQHVSRVLDRMVDTTIRGQRARIRPARPGESDRRRGPAPDPRRGGPPPGRHAVPRRGPR